MDRSYEFVQRLWQEKAAWAASHGERANRIYSRRAGWAKGKPYEEIDRAWKRLHERCWKTVDDREAIRRSGDKEGEKALSERIYSHLVEIEALVLIRMSAFLKLSDAEKEEWEKKGRSA